MADSPTLIEALKIFGMVFGPGGAAIAVVAYLNRKPTEPASAPAPAPVPIETPWLIQNLLEIKLNGEGTKHSVDALTAAVMSLSQQINLIAALLRRELKD